jgi:5-methylcytosine-specific restriction endonuclease McrA
VVVKNGKDMQQKERLYSLDLVGTSETCYCQKCGGNTEHRFYLRSRKTSLEKKCLACKRRKDNIRPKNRNANNESCKKYRQTEKYKAFTLKLSGKQKEKTLLKGKFTRVFSVRCILCSKVQIKKWIKGKSFIREIKCDDCCKPGVAMIGVIMRVKEIGCKRCGIMHNGKQDGAMCNACLKESYREQRRAFIKAQRAAGKRKAESFNARGRKACRLTGAAYESINRKKVFDRDLYKCYICSCSIVVTDKYEPMQASIDHVVPLSLGGSHTYSNVKACCMLCNSIKSNKEARGTPSTSLHLSC